MRTIHAVRLAVIMFLLTGVSHPRVHGDEGMWLFNNPPRELLADRYGFDVTDEWLEHVQKASVRFNSGGSGSLVSASGLLMTNHHVGADALQKLSTAERDLLNQGFHARSAEEELKCVDLEVNVLVSIEDVTQQVNEAVGDEADPAKAQLARRAAINTIEKESLDATGLRSDVITLYHGGKYHLYRFKKYTDIRLVFAPEKDIAFFGGDPDNFEFPRYDLDVCFFRAYEDDKPAQVEHYLKWSQSGAGDGELVFVSGHPGRTNRLNTIDHLQFIRDRVLPLTLNVLRRREVNLRIYYERSRENARRSQDELFGYQNSRKARLGGLAGLQDPSIMQQKQAAEEALRQAVSENSELREAYGDAWDQVAQSLLAWDEIYEPHYLLERGTAFNTELFNIARSIVRLTEESEKPNAQRLPEFAEAGLESLKQQLFSEAPIYADLETVKLADSLGMWLEMAGSDDELARQVMGDLSPPERAAALVDGSRLADVAVRRELVDGGRSAVQASDDPMIQLAMLVDEPARQLRKTYEEQVDEAQRQGYAKIAKAQFELYGDTIYPDATFTLRLAFGEVKGYRQRGEQIAPWTTLGGAYRHAREHDSVAPFELPASWLEHKDDLDLDTPFNFVCTADIIGGNSGSPVINRQGELVGIIFDGNMYSLVLDFIYTQEQARAVSVHSAGIIEALKNVYHADRLLAELKGKDSKAARRK